MAAALIVIALLGTVLLSSILSPAPPQQPDDDRPANDILTLNTPTVMREEPPRATPTPRPLNREPIVRPTTAPPPPMPTDIPVTPGVMPNELGRIPILMYHAFVHEEANTDDWTVTFDQFHEQLDWLRENDFVMIGFNSVIDRRFDIPAGKRPVVLTFDDSSAGQFGLQRSPDGGYEVQPDTAVGVLESYRQEYPEFGGPAFFAVLPYNCFASEDDPSTCEERLAWLVEHDYEVGNHTMGHQNLRDVSMDRFKEEVFGPVDWFAERVTGENVRPDVIVLPFGAYPRSREQIDLLFEASPHPGGFFTPSLVVEVGSTPARSPFHKDWEPNLPRYNTKPEIFWYWAEQIESGEMVIFTSDGDPDRVTIPAGWEKVLNEGLVQDDGYQIVVLPA